MFGLFYFQKTVCLCMFYVDWGLEGWKRFKGREFLVLKIVRILLQETNNFFRSYEQLAQNYLTNLCSQQSKTALSLPMLRLLSSKAQECKDF